MSSGVGKGRGGKGSGGGGRGGSRCRGGGKGSGGGGVKGSGKGSGKGRGGGKGKGRGGGKGGRGGGKGKGGRGGGKGGRNGGGKRQQQAKVCLSTTTVACGLGLNCRQAPFRTVIALLVTRARAAGGMAHDVVAQGNGKFNDIAWENKQPLPTAALEALFCDLEARGDFDRAAHARVLARLRTLPSGRVALRARGGTSAGGYLCCTGAGAVGWAATYAQRAEEEFVPEQVARGGDQGGWALRCCDARYLGQRAAVGGAGRLTVTASDATPRLGSCVFRTGAAGSGGGAGAAAAAPPELLAAGTELLAAGTVLSIAGAEYVVEHTPPGLVDVEKDWARGWAAALAHCCRGPDAGCALELLLAIYATNTQWEKKAAASALVSDAAQAAEENDIHAGGLGMLEALGGLEDDCGALGAALEQLDKSEVKYCATERRLPRDGGRYTVGGRADGAYMINGTVVISDAKKSGIFSDDALLQVMLYAHIYQSDLAFCVAEYRAHAATEGLAAAEVGAAADEAGQLTMQRLYAVDVSSPHVARYLHEELLGGADELVGALIGAGAPSKAFLASFLAQAALRRREQAFLTFVKQCPPVDLSRLGGSFAHVTEQRVAALRGSAARLASPRPAADEAQVEEAKGEAGEEEPGLVVDPWESQCVRAPEKVFLATLRRRTLPFFVAKQVMPPAPPDGVAAAEAEGGGGAS